MEKPQNGHEGIVSGNNFLLCLAKTWDMYCTVLKHEFNFELHVISEGSFGGNQMGSWGWGGAGNTDTSVKAPDAWNMATNWAAAPPPPPPEPAVVSKACLLMMNVETIINSSISFSFSCLIFT